MKGEGRDLRSLSMLVEVSERLRSTTKRKEKIAILAEYMRRLPLDVICEAVSFLAGELRGKALTLGAASLEEAYRTCPSREGSLTILEVEDFFRQMRSLKGPGSYRKRIELLLELFSRCGEEEKEFITRLLMFELRQGALKGIIKEAIKVAFSIPSHVVENALMLSGDIGLVARAAKEGNIERISFSLFRPIEPMLASPASLDEIHKIHPSFSCEYKVDGARIQAHRRGEEVKIFTRHLKDVTERLPEIVEILQGVSIEEFVLEGEVFALDPGGRPLPFQVLMRRFGRRKGVEEHVSKIPVSIYFFDCLYRDGEVLFNVPYRERWRMLEDLVPLPFRIPRIRDPKMETLEEFLKESLESGHEGLMVKDLDSPYVAGMRGKHWLKIKPAQSLDLVVIGAEWGHGRRKGWLSNYLLACRNPERGDFLPVGKTFKGLTDSEFRWMTERLLSMVKFQDQYMVFVDPRIVVEVTFNEIQKSPHYSSGFALRFARISRIRDEKGPLQADTIHRVRELFENQFKFKGRLISL